MDEDSGLRYLFDQGRIGRAASQVPPAPCRSVEMRVQPGRSFDLCMKGGEKHEMTSLPLLVPAPIEIGAGTVKGLFSGNGATARSGLLRSAAGSAFGSLLSARLANLTGTVTSPRASAKAGST